MMDLCIAGVRGHVGYVLQVLESLPEVRLVGVCKGDSEENISVLINKGNEIGAEFRVYEDYTKMLESESPDIVCVCGPFEKHAEMSIEALKRGAHVFCEKPVAMNLDELDRLEYVYNSLENKPHYISMVGLRFEPAFMAAWKAVKSGAVGKIRMLNGRKSYKLGNRPDYYRERKTYGGTIPWVGIHAIDWIYWFAGVNFKTVYATHSTLENGDNGTLESTASCIFTMDNEISATVTCDYYRPVGAKTHGDDRLRVVGTEGIVEVTDQRAIIIDKNGKRDLPLFESEDIFSNFVSHIVDGTEPIVSAEQTFAVTRASLFARDSADSGEMMCFN